MISMVKEKELSLAEINAKIKEEVLDAEERYKELQEKLEEAVFEKEFVELANKEHYELLEEMLNQFDALGIEFREVVDNLYELRLELKGEIDSVREVKDKLFAMLAEEIDRLNN